MSPLNNSEKSGRPPMNTKLVLILFSTVLFLNCKDSSPDITPDDDTNTVIENDLYNSEYNILFVGNSLTYINDLPALVRQEGEINGIKIGTKSIAKGNYALIDHWNEGYVQQEIESGKYDFVVVQQGPSSQEEGRKLLLQSGKDYSDLCNEHGAKLAFFMVWPSMNYYQTFDGVIKNYTDAATQNDALLCPVGKVWKKHFDTTGEFDYYSPDGFHPSLKGSEVAAQVILGTLFP